MNVIFLDFNGVLDTYTDMDMIDEENLNILKQIVDATNSKVVISSSIKNTYYFCGKHNLYMLNLIETLQNNGIVIYGITPYLDSKEEEILHYLSEHKKIRKYCIIEDEYLGERVKSHIIKLKEQLYGGDGLKTLGTLKIINYIKKIYSI